MNVESIAAQMVDLVKQEAPNTVAIDMSRVPDLEYSALQYLMQADQKLAKQGMTFWLVGLNPSVLEAVRNSGLADQLGPERLLFNAREAISKYQSQ